MSSPCAGRTSSVTHEKQTRRLTENNIIARRPAVRQQRSTRETVRVKQQQKKT